MVALSTYKLEIIVGCIDDCLYDWKSGLLVLLAGEGQYGKVYTCISVDTGELMAMKEVSHGSLGLCVT